MDIQPTNEEACPRFLENALKSCARKKTQRKDYGEKGDPDIFRCLSIVDSMAEYGFLYYENNSKVGSTLIEVCTFTKLENYELLEPFSGNSVKAEVPPGENLIAVMKRTDRSSSYTCTYYSSILLSDEKLLENIKTKGKKTQIKY